MFWRKKDDDQDQITETDVQFVPVMIKKHKDKKDDIEEIARNLGIQTTSPSNNAL